MTKPDIYNVLQLLYGLYTHSIEHKSGEYGTLEKYLLYLTFYTPSQLPKNMIYFYFFHLKPD